MKPAFTVTEFDSLLPGIDAGRFDLKVRATGERSQASIDEAAQAARSLLGAAP
jgi:hypothetical protein